MWVTLLTCPPTETSHRLATDTWSLRRTSCGAMSTNLKETNFVMPPIASRNRTATRYQTCINSRDPNITVMVNVTTKMKQSRSLVNLAKRFTLINLQIICHLIADFPTFPRKYSVPLFDSAESTGSRNWTSPLYNISLTCRTLTYLIVPSDMLLELPDLTTMLCSDCAYIEP